MIKLRWYNCDDKIAMIPLRCSYLSPSQGFTYMTKVSQKRDETKFSKLITANVECSMLRLFFMTKTSSKSKECRNSSKAMSFYF